MWWQVLLAALGGFVLIWLMLLGLLWLTQRQGPGGVRVGEAMRLCRT